VQLEEGVILNSLSYTEFKEILKKLKMLPDDEHLLDTMKGLEFELFDLIKCTQNANVE